METLIAKYGRYIFVGLGITLVVIAFFLSWTIRGCQNEAEYQRAMTTIMANEQAHMDLLKKQQETFSGIQDKFIEYNKYVDGKIMEERQALEEKITTLEKQMQTDLNGVSTEIRKRLETEQEKLR